MDINALLLRHFEAIQQANQNLLRDIALMEVQAEAEADPLAPLFEATVPLTPAGHSLLLSAIETGQPLRPLTVTFLERNVFEYPNEGIPRTLMPKNWHLVSLEPVIGRTYSFLCVQQKKNLIPVCCELTDASGISPKKLSRDMMLQDDALLEVTIDAVKGRLHATRKNQ